MEAWGLGMFMHIPFGVGYGSDVHIRTMPDTIRTPVSS